MIKSTLVFSLKVLLIWVAILIASIVGALVLGLDEQPDAGHEPMGAGAAFLLVNLLHALVLSALALRATAGRWRLGLLVASTLFLAQSFLLVIEALYFADSVRVPMDQLVRGSAVSLFAAIAVGAVVALLWKGEASEARPAVQVRTLIIPVFGVALLYVVAYFTAGYFIAWAVPEVRAYYGDGLEIELLSLLGFQVFRGLIWAMLALAIVRSLKPGVIGASLVVGACFSVLASAQLLYPNAFMPWEVRLPHLVEVSISNFLFGAIAAMILRDRRRVALG